MTIEGTIPTHRRFSRIRALAIPVLALVFLLVITGGSCTAVVRAPSVVEDPVSVYLIKEAKHRGLILPRASGGFVEYGYGDFDYYALMKNRWYHLFDTVLWPTRGCLGRRGIPEVEGAPVRSCAELIPLRVERSLVIRLLGSLDDAFTSRIGTLHENSVYPMNFVEAERGFYMGYNCNDATAEWFEALGCLVSATFITTDVEVDGITTDVEVDGITTDVEVDGR